MNKYLIGFVLGISVAILPAFKVANYIPNESTAEVNKHDDFYVFTDSQPITPYDVLGEVELGFISGTQYDNIKTNLLKRARKMYPYGNGVIFILNKNGMDKCKVIKFK
jgi:hypothetical protein